MNLVHEGVLPPNEPDDRDERMEEWEMAQKRETVADIVAELRNKTGNMYDCTITTDEEEFHSYADRIEEAWELEREELDKRISDLEAYAKLWTGRADELRLKCDEFYAKAKHVGNAAAMREALVKIHGIAKTFMDATRMRHVTDSARIDVADIEALAKAALAATPRQCDVGTAEEQYERYRHRCNAQDCCYCPVRKRWDFSRTGSESCQLVWAQMPYDEQEGGAK